MKSESQMFSDPALIRQAVIASFSKLNPRVQWRNPVMFIVLTGSVFTTLLAIATLSGMFYGHAAFTLAISCWLWLTLLFANFAEALAEGRSQAQAGALRDARQTVMAKKLTSPHYGSASEAIVASALRKGDVVLAEAGEIIPCDGEVIQGGASVDESAITGESAR